MRALLLLLLLVANVLAFAWWRGHLDAWMPSGLDPGRVSRQVAPERLEVVPLERLEAARRLAGCVEFGPLDDARAERVAAWVRDSGGRAELLAAGATPRVRFADGTAAADVQSGTAELAAIAGGEPRACGTVP